MCCDCKINPVSPKFIRCDECQLIKTLQLPADFFKKETGLSLVVSERLRVLQNINRGRANDLWLYQDKQLVRVAKDILYLSKKPSLMSFLNPCNWDKKTWDKMIHSSYKRRLVIAGQLIVAELDRIITMEEK